VHKYTVGKQHDGAHRLLLRQFAPAWNTILQSLRPLGTAKYFINDLIGPLGGIMYFHSTNFLILVHSTSLLSGLRGGCCRLEDGLLLVNITLTPRFTCVR
jgi:hypothetical protein